MTLTALREYAVSPGLVSTLPGVQYSRQRKKRGLNNGADDATSIPERLSWSELRSQKVLDTGISGAATGGLLRGLKCTSI